MNKKQVNIILTILGIILIMLFFYLWFGPVQNVGYGEVYPFLVIILPFIGFILITFGIINYWNWRPWIKIISSIVIGILFTFLIGGILLYLYCATGGICP